MSNNDFNRAVDFLQGALNAATFSASEKPQDNVQQEAEDQKDAEPVLPGFESSPAFVPEQSAQAKSEDRHVVHIRTEKTALQLHPPAQKRAELAEQASQNASRKVTFRLNPAIALAALSGVLGVSLIVACLFLLRSPEPPTEQVSNDIPFALLPETADPSLWNTVTKMHGEIDGVPLRFEHGIAEANGTVYKLQLDFCRNGSDIYAKVTGDKLYVVRLDDQGRITKSYPAPKNNKPLKDIFGK